MSRLAQLRRYSARLMLALTPLVWHPVAVAQVQAPESELKAAIIANMLLFVEWPVQRTSSNQQLTICYLDENPVANALAQLDGKSVKGKSLRVMQTTPEKASSCHAIYLSPNSVPSLPRISATTPDPLPILLIGDAPGYIRRGIMINLEAQSGRIIFDINLKTMQAANLNVSSKALRLARLVIE